MKIIVSNKPRTKFNNDLLNITNDYINYEDLIFSSDTNNLPSTLTPTLNDSSKVIVFTAEGASTLNSHVFEKFPDSLKILQQSERFEYFLINNPSNMLLKILKTVSNVSYESTYFFKKTSENDIRTVSRNFNKTIIGQNQAKKSVLRSLTRTLVRKDSNKPLVLMFYGKPGIGKTETAKYLAKELYDGDIVREQMSMATNDSSINYFKSTSHNENSFSKTLMNRSSNIILLDEFALAHPLIHTAFFQLFDEGIYTDNNYSINLRNSIIICTSNILSREAMYHEIDEALLSRFDAFIPFNPFTDEEKKTIVTKIAHEFQRNINQKYQSKIDWDQKIEELKSTTTQLTNMRNIKNYVEESFANELLDYILSSK